MSPARAARALASLPPPPLAPLFAALDAVRERFLSALGPAATRAVVVPRERRIALAASLLFAAAALATCARPLWLLAIGPLVWGVPHLLADVRYLVARPRLHRRGALFVAAAVCLAGAAAGLGVRAGIAAAACAVVASRAGAGRRALGVAACAALFAIAQAFPAKADVLFLQAHNLIAIAFWFWWRRRSTRLAVLPLCVLAAGAALILAGPVDRWLAVIGGAEAEWTGLTLDQLAETLSPSNDPALGRRFVLLFAFAQAAHYAVWLHLVPQEDQRAPTPRSFRQGYRALGRDVGPLVLWVAAASAAVVAAAAFVSLPLARDAYLGIAFFHAYLEVIAAAVLWTEGIRPRDAPSAAVART